MNSKNADGKAQRIMYYSTYGTSAYKLERQEYTENKAPARKKKTAPAKKKQKAVSFKTVLTLAAVFALVFATLGRYVKIYGQHDEIVQKEKQLDTLKMANDQLDVEIESLTDSTRIEQYAGENLNLRKMDSNQIVYLGQSTGDNMEKIAKNKKSIFKGIFGIFSGALEYLK